MAWTAPRTWVVGEVLTAALLNTHVRDNLTDLDARTTATSASVATAQTTTSTSFTDLATVGPAVTVTTGTQALVAIYGQMATNTGGQGIHMAFAVSGATTRSAQDVESAGFTANAVANLYGAFSSVVLVTGLTAGSNVFTCKYRAIGSGTATFQNRKIVVWPGNKLA